MNRCQWVKNDPLEIIYHDTEWGVPVHDDQKLFEFLILEGAQAGLSWTTILKKRDSYRQAFDSFEPTKVACYDEQKQQKLLQNLGIVRNRLKIESAIVNAQKCLEVQEEFATFDTYIWQFIKGETIQNYWTSLAEIPAKIQVSDAISKDLKKRGFKFVGSTIYYAFMQAVGMVNNHTVDCFRHRELLRNVIN